MNTLTKELTGALKPVAALIAYKMQDNAYRSEYYLEARSIGNDGMMGTGKPVTRRFMESLAENFTKDTSSTPYGVLPQGMLYADARKGREKYIWFTPPQKRRLFFKRDLNISDGEYWLPGLVWHAERNLLNLYACKSKRASPNMCLYSAPFFNVSPESGSVCLGNANMEQPGELTFQTLIKYREDLFFLSEFSHISGRNPTKTNLVLVVKNSTDSFNNDELILIPKRKLTDLLK